MSNINSKNFYEVLGIDRSADARTVKKAYFTLVRKYPPETKAAEFQKIREAYEVLSDDDARRDYDSIGFDQRDSAISGEVSLALEAMDEGRFADARKILTTLLQANPGLAFARDLLGTAFLRDKMAPNAAAIFQSLVTQHPENASYVLHLGYAQHAQKQLPQAEASYRKAVTLSKEDVRPLVALSDCLMDQKRWDDAIATLDQAINLDGSVDFRDFALFTRKLEVEAERRNPQGLIKVLNELKKIIPPDEAGKKFVANRLAAIAAPLFAQKLPDLANLMMKEAAAIDPSRGTGQMPSSFTLELETLPQASQQWLQRHRSEKTLMKMDHSPRAWPIVALILGAPALFALFAFAFLERRPLPPEVIFMLAAGLALITWMLAASVVRLIDIQKSPYGKYVTVHPFFLLDVNVNRLTAWPLANLHDVKLTHHHTNGVYSTTNIQLIFAKRTYNTAIYGKEKSVEWANNVLASRRRMLETMFSGLSEESNPDASLIPARLVPDEGKSAPPTENAKKRTKRFWTVLGACAGAGALLAAVLFPLNAVKKDNSDFDDAKYEYEARRKVQTLKGYLELHPTGRHVDEANAAMDAIYDEALAKVEAHRTAAMAPLMREMLTTMKTQRSTRIDVSYQSRTDFAGIDASKLPAKIKNDLIDPELAFTDSANQGRESVITGAIQASLDEVVGSLITVGAGSSRYDYRLHREVAPEPAAGKFVIAYDVLLTGSMYTSDATRNAPERHFWGIGFVWDFGVKLGDDDTLKHHFNLASRPAKDIRWNSSGAGQESPTLPYDKMAESAFDDFKVRLTQRFLAVDGAADAASDDEMGDADDEKEAAPAPPPRRAPKPTRQRPHR